MLRLTSLLFLASTPAFSLPSPNYCTYPILSLSNDVPLGDVEYHVESSMLSTGESPKLPADDSCAGIISVKFPCPYGNSIPLSQVNDGVCDCCDGSDEQEAAGGGCRDQCGELKRREEVLWQRL